MRNYLILREKSRGVPRRPRGAGGAARRPRRRARRTPTLAEGESLADLRAEAFDPEGPAGAGWASSALDQLALEHLLRRALRLTVARLVAGVDSLDPVLQGRRGRRRHRARRPRGPRRRTPTAPRSTRPLVVRAGRGRSPRPAAWTTSRPSRSAASSTAWCASTRTAPSSGRPCCGTTPAPPTRPRELTDELGGPGGLGATPSARCRSRRSRSPSCAGSPTTSPRRAARTAAVCLPHDWLTWRLARHRRPRRPRHRPQRRQRHRLLVAGDAATTAATCSSCALGHDALTAPGRSAPDEAAGRTGAGAAARPRDRRQRRRRLGPGAGPGDVVVSIGTSGVVSRGLATCRPPTPAAPSPGSPTPPAASCPWSRRSTRRGSSTSTARLLGVDHAGLGDLALSAPAGRRRRRARPLPRGRAHPRPAGRDRRPSSGSPSATTTPANLARAAVEGLLCGLADGLDALRAQGAAVEPRAAGRRRRAARAAVADRARRARRAGRRPPPGRVRRRGAARQAAWVLAGAAEPPDWALAPRRPPRGRARARPCGSATPRRATTCSPAVPDRTLARRPTWRLTGAMASDARLIATRRSLHGLAELVLAGPQHAQTGEITLRAVPGRVRHHAHARPTGRGHRRRRPDGEGRHRRSLPRGAGRRARGERDLLGRRLRRRPGRRARRAARGGRRRRRADRRRLRLGRRRPAGAGPGPDPGAVARALRHRDQRPRGQLRGLGRRHVPRGPLRLRRPLVAAAAGRLLERALRPRPPHGGDRRGPAGLLHRGPGPARRGER